MKLAIGLALLALLAAVGYVLAKPKWRWDSKSLTPVDEPEPPTVVDIVKLPKYVTPARAADIWARYSTGSPESVTSRADNGTIDPRLLGV